eukprot:scpid46263/ scgid5448/ Acid-sensing ion channel 1; Acid-sensing ion channel 1.3; Amiloride-sensitive cation channel 2-C, neuronal; ZASIC1.3
MTIATTMEPFEDASAKLGNRGGRRIWRNGSVGKRRAVEIPTNGVTTQSNGHSDDHVRSLSNASSFLKTSTLHGLRFWPTYPNQPRFWFIVQLLWILLTLGALGAVTYFSYDAVNKYLQYKTTTHYDVQRASTLPFPSVTVCNFNPLRFTDILGGLKEDTSLSTLPNLYLLCTLYHLSDKFCEESLVSDKIAADNRTLGEIYAEFGHKKWQMIPDIGPPWWYSTGCKFAGRPCSGANFSTTISEYGNCYTFNGDQNSQLVSRAQGQKAGLEVVLNVEQDEYFSRGTTAVGMAVFIHPPHRPLLAYHEALALTPGTENFLAIRARKTVREPKPYNGPDFCITPDEGKAIVQYYQDYSLAACKKECAARFVYDRCGCRMPEMPPLLVDGQVMKVCKLFDTIACGEKERDYFESNYEAQLEYCVNCKEPCNETGFQYTYSLTSSNFLEHSNSLQMIQALDAIGIDLGLLKEDSTNDTSDTYRTSLTGARENLLKLVVYFDDLNFEERKEIPVYPLVSMLGDLGGNLGLFLGASILTIIEVIQFALTYTHRKAIVALKKREVVQRISRAASRRQLVTWTDGLAAEKQNAGDHDATVVEYNRSSVALAAENRV